MRATLPSGSPLPPGCTLKNGRYYIVVQNRWHALSRVEEGDVAFWSAYYRITAGDPNTIAGILIAYMDKGMSELAPTTQAKYRSYIVLRLIPALGHIHRADFGSDLVAEYLDKRMEARAPIAGNRERACLSSACEYAMRKRWLKTNPCRNVKRNKERPSRVYVEHEQLVSALERAKPELANLLAVAYLWGARQTDLRLLTWAQVPAGDRAEPYVRIDESKTSKARSHQITATVRYFLEEAAAHREAVAKRYEAAAAELERLSMFRRAGLRRAKAAAVRAEQHVFLTHRGLPWSESGLQSAMRRLSVDFTFRQLRPKAETDAPGTLGHTGQMQGRYTRRERLKAVK